MIINARRADSNDRDGDGTGARWRPLPSRAVRLATLQLPLPRGILQSTMVYMFTTIGLWTGMRNMLPVGPTALDVLKCLLHFTASQNPMV